MLSETIADPAQDTGSLVASTGRFSSIFGPFRFPVTDAKKFRYAVFRSARDCWRITADTSASHARSGGTFTAVSRADSSRR